MVVLYQGQPDDFTKKADYTVVGTAKSRRIKEYSRCRTRSSRPYIP